ncbi:MAG: toprim domain-containing protein, partial [Paracoccaceae bacterium]
MPYHTRKQVELIGARLEDNVVVVPLYNPKLEEVAQQTIAPDGAKRNTKGLDKSGGVFGLCGALPEDGIAYIAEGWATAASVALATSKCCIFALDCHNLPLVCEKIAEIRPRLQIIVAADNDDAGIEAATKTGLRWAAPNQDGADWNDVWVRSGHVPIVEGLKRAKRPGALFQKMSEIKVVPPQWIIDGMFEADTLAIVFGGSGEGKTFVVADAAMCIATGTAYHGHAVEKG